MDRGPGTYQTEKCENLLSTNKKIIEVKFGTSPKTSQFDKSREELSPGPGSYNPTQHYITK